MDTVVGWLSWYRGSPRSVKKVEDLDLHVGDSGVPLLDNQVVSNKPEIVSVSEKLGSEIEAAATIVDSEGIVKVEQGPHPNQVPSSLTFLAPNVVSEDAISHSPDVNVVDLHPIVREGDWSLQVEEVGKSSANPPRTESYKWRVDSRSEGQEEELGKQVGGFGPFPETVQVPRTWAKVVSNSGLQPSGQLHSLARPLE
ncbi:hypothetical protein U1Q18_032027 [Sarracenia purpurea var. burkii]